MQELALPEELTIYNVSSLREEMLELLAGKEDLVLDGSQVQEIDAAGVQLLLSLEKTTLREDFTVQLTDITAEGEEILEAAGVKELLMGGQKNE